MTISPEQREPQDDMERIIAEARERWKADFSRWQSDIMAARWGNIRRIEARRPNEITYTAQALREAGYRKADPVPVKPVDLVEEPPRGWPCERTVSGLCADPKCWGGQQCQAALCTPPLRARDVEQESEG